MSEQRAESAIEELEIRLRQVARHFPFPPTPNISRSLSNRGSPTSRPVSPAGRWVWVSLTAAILAAILLVTPPVRAVV